MKKSLLIICSGLLLMAGCKEVGPAIDFGGGVSADTSWMLTTIPTTMVHNVLVEDFTGQGCSNCPAAHENLESEVSANAAGRINIMGLYILNFPQTNPPAGSTYDLRDSTATAISSTFYNNVGELPTVGVDRVPVSGSLGMTSSGLWDGAITSQLNATDSLNLQVQSRYAGTVATTTVTVTYTQPVNYTQNINIALVEDSIINIQEYPSGVGAYPGGFDDSYVFMDVFRGMVTSGVTGDIIYPKNPASKPAGLVYQRVYTYALPSVLTTDFSSNPPIQPNHCRVIAFVTNTGTNRSIAQSAQTPLMGY